MIAVNKTERNAFCNSSPKYWETGSHQNVRCSDNLPQLVRATLDSFPAPHNVQEEAPEEELYVPAAHDVQEEAPEEELYVPAAHNKQEEAPEVELYVPVGQLVQEDMLELLYSPTGQLTEKY